MKNDIKKLYKKDKKLAIQVAKALGMKIVVAKKLDTKRAVVDKLNSIKKHLPKIVIETDSFVKNYSLSGTSASTFNKLKKAADSINKGLELLQEFTFEIKDLE